MKIKVADRLGDVQEYYFSKKLREIADLRNKGFDVINLGVGSPDQMPSPRVIQALQTQAALDDQHGYQSYTGIPALRRALSDWYERYFAVSLDPDADVLPLIGSKEGIMHISMTYLQSGDAVLIPDPGYLSYGATAQLAGARVLYYSLTSERDWYPDLEELGQLDLDEVKLMWINYPHMPSGAAANLDLFEELVQFCQSNKILLCHDNPYAFILNEKPYSIFQVPGAKDVAMELTSLSKSYNMAGWRVGFLTGHPDRIKDVLRFKSNMDSGMFKPVQMAAVEALAQDQQWFDQLNQVYHQRRNVAEEIIHQLGCTFDPKQVGMFLWAQIPERYENGYEFTDLLLKESQVFITPGNIFGENGKRFIRLSLCSSIDRLNEALARCRTIDYSTAEVR